MGRQISRSYIQYRPISNPGWTHRLRTGDNSERPRSLSDLHFPLLRSWQKRRFLPAETKLMSEKAPQATFSNELESCVIALAGANPQNAENVRDEYLAVADLAGLRRPDDGFHDLIDQFVLHRHFDAGL